MEVLSIGILSDNEKVRYALNLLQTPSLYDLDAIVVDSSRIWPVQLNCQPGSSANVGLLQSMSPYREAFSVKGIEALHLVSRGGTIVCLLQPLAMLTSFESTGKGSLQKLQMSQYDWLPITSFASLVQQGQGEHITRTKSSPFDEYLKPDRVRWVAHLTNVNDSTQFQTLARNKADFPVACRFRIGLGAIYVLPYSTNPKFFEVILNCLAKSSQGHVRRRAPDWIMSWALPGEGELSKQISDVTDKITALQTKSQELKTKLYELSLVKSLLYERDSPLEDAVKAAFKELGLSLAKDDEKDFVFSGTEERVIFEVTGSEGTIDVDKFRQLLDYLTTENKEGISAKSILVGNHQIDSPPEKRGQPFTQKAVAQSKVHDTCLLPTVELYRAIVKVRQGKVDPKAFWKSLVETSGVFSLGTSKLGERPGTVETSVNTVS